MTTPEQDAGTPTPLPDDIWIDYTVECFRCGGSGCLECNMSGRRPRYFDEWKKTECELTALRAAHEAAQTEIATLRELVRDANDLLDDARSGYIGGCGEDLKWDKRREEFREAIREKL